MDMSKVHVIRQLKAVILSAIESRKSYWQKSQKIQFQVYNFNFNYAELITCPHKPMS